MTREAAGAANDLGFFLIRGLGEIAGAEDLVAMDGEEAFDSAEEESDAAFAVAVDEPAGGQAAATPALDGFAGDVESFGDIFDGHHRFGGVGYAEIE